MAKSKGASKSQAIRDYLGTNPEATAKEVVEALGKKGIEVNDGLVYAVKGAMKEKQARKKRIVKAAKAAARSASSNGTTTNADAITMIREVKAIAQKAGGYAKLKELVDALAE